MNPGNLFSGSGYSRKLSNERNWRLLGTGPIFEFGSKSAIGQTTFEAPR